jgi:hypothetical protein
MKELILFFAFFLLNIGIIFIGIKLNEDILKLLGAVVSVCCGFGVLMAIIGISTE